jgi:hypothetical protein
MGIQADIFKEIQFVFRQTKGTEPRMARIARIGNGPESATCIRVIPEIRGTIPATPSSLHPPLDKTTGVEQEATEGTEVATRGQGNSREKAQKTHNHKNFRAPCAFSRPFFCHQSYEPLC